MRKIFTTAACCFMITISYAQPYLDLASISYTGGPDAGAWRRNHTGNSFRYYTAGLNIPLILDKDSNMIVLSPFAERWGIDIDNISDLPSYMQSLVLQAAYIRSLSKRWSVALSAIPRWNGNRSDIFKNNFQMGGAVLASYKQKQNLVWKFGLYYNGELSGAYFVPLAGIDWRINSKDNLFGVLPGSLAFEHKVTDGFYYGFSFNAVTNTYDAGFVTTGNIPKYLRISDNQLSFFGCSRIAKNVYANLEAGHSMFRSLKLGVKDRPVKYYYANEMNDGLLFKVSLNYRIRL